MTSRKPTYVSLFSGAGGLDLGLEMAGWRTAYASDNDPVAVETLKGNVGRKIENKQGAFDGTFIECADVRALDPISVLDKAGLRRGSVQLLAGGPPCQSWSSAGHQLGFDDPRGRLFEDFLRIADGIEPRWLLLENVRGLLTARAPGGEPGSALQHIRRNLLAHGFQTTVSLLNSADYGVPQRRVRLFMIGFRSGDAPLFPLPTHSKTADLEGRVPWLTLGHALTTIRNLSEAEIFRPSGKMASELRDIKPGSGVKSPGKSERTRPNGHWGYKQGAFVADATASARTVTASAQQDWIQDPIRGLRRLCPRECAAIQSFPNDWRFHGSAVAQYRLIGNAVPPLLAKAIGRSMLEQIKPNKKANLAEHVELLPLPPRLQYHVRYTEREELSNGQSRRAVPGRRVVRSELAKA